MTKEYDPAYLIEQINEQLEGKMREAFLHQVATSNYAFVWEELYRYVSADDDSKADIRAFFEPMADSALSAAEYIVQLKQKDADGTPTAVDLERQFTSRCNTCARSSTQAPMITIEAVEHGWVKLSYCSECPVPIPTLVWTKSSDGPLGRHVQVPGDVQTLKVRLEARGFRSNVL